eukprot:scaffold122709_cov36-Prasinocladus_malaysianus.AAC.1
MSRSIKNATLMTTCKHSPSSFDRDVANYTAHPSAEGSPFDWPACAFMSPRVHDKIFMTRIYHCDASSSINFGCSPSWGASGIVQIPYNMAGSIIDKAYLLGMGCVGPMGPSENRLAMVLASRAAS